MPALNNQVDAYIEQSADFAKPILNHIRQLVHEACPNISETIKWGFPHFEYQGVICHMASFKQHCTFGFWNAPLLADKHQILSIIGKTSMGHLGKLHSLSDLPADAILLEYLKEAVHLNENKQKSKPAARAKAPEKKETPVPDYLQEALNQNNAARQTFDNFSPGNRKEYIVWLNEAKTDATRDKRLATTLEWLAEGKTRHWKYLKK